MPIKFFNDGDYLIIQMKIIFGSRSTPLSNYHTKLEKYFHMVTYSTYIPFICIFCTDIRNHFVWKIYYLSPCIPNKLVRVIFHFYHFFCCCYIEKIRRFYMYLLRESILTAFFPNVAYTFTSGSSLRDLWPAILLFL